MPERTVVSVVSSAYLPQMRVLADSLLENHATIRIAVVVVDGDGEPTRHDEPFEVLSPLDIGVDEGELHRRAGIYDAQGLISSLRSLAMQWVLASGAESVLLLDADMLVLAPLDDLWELAREHQLLLSPHSLWPLAGETGAWDEELLLRFGTFNGGLVGVGAGGQQFLSWLVARAARDCVADLARGIFYTQTWLNLAPALFPHHVLRDAGVNVTAHGLSGRDLERSAESLEFDGTPVRLFHFTGFDPADPGVLCRHLPDARGSVAGRPLLAALCERYAARLQARGWGSATAYGWGSLPDGTAVDASMRDLYRRALLAAEQGLAAEPPDPFDRDDSAAFSTWLRDVSAGAPL